MLPVLVGFAVDYAIQFQSRVQEARADGGPRRGGRASCGRCRADPRSRPPPPPAARRCWCCMLSPVPTVRGFGLLLVARHRDRLPLRAHGRLARCSARVAGARRTARCRCRPRVGARCQVGSVRQRIAAAVPPGCLVARCARAAGRQPAHPLASRGPRWCTPCAIPGVSSASVSRWRRSAGRWTPRRTSQTNLEKLVPQNTASLRNLDTLERLSGVGGEIDLMVSGRHLATPAVIDWMSSYENTVLGRFGYTSTRGCGKAELCPAFSLPDLFQGGALGEASKTQAPKLTRAEIRALLGVIPPYFSQDVLTRQPACRDVGVRDSSDAPRPAAAGDRRDALGPAPAARGQRPARRPTGTRGAVRH